MFRLNIKRFAGGGRARSPGGHVATFSILVYVTSKLVNESWSSNCVATGAYYVPDENSTIKAACVGAVYPQGPIIPSRATDLLKINAPYLRQSRSVSFPTVTRMIALHSPVNTDGTSRAARRNLPVTSKTLEDKRVAQVSRLFQCERRTRDRLPLTLDGPS